MLWVVVHQRLAISAEDTEVHGAGVQVDTTIKVVLVGVKSHEVSSSCLATFPTTSISLGYAEEGGLNKSQSNGVDHANGSFVACEYHPWRGGLSCGGSAPAQGDAQDMPPPAASVAGSEPCCCSSAHKPLGFLS